MSKKEYSIELTKMLAQLDNNPGQPITSIDRIKTLEPLERKIYLDALEVKATEWRKQFDDIVNKGEKEKE